MNKKVLVVDYDRTLYINHNDMLNNIKAIDKFRSKGNIFIIATGRTYNSLKNEIDKYGINYDYLILNHGALVIKKDNTPLFHYKLNRNDLLDINNYLNKLNPKDIFYSYYLNDTKDINNLDISKVTVALKSNSNNFKDIIVDIIKKYKLAKIDFLKVGHHDSKTSSSKEFISKINPKYSIISVGRKNKYGHPNKETMETLKNENIEVHRSDECGHILVKSTGNGLVTNCDAGSYSYGR